MGRMKTLEGVRMISFRSVLDRYEAVELNQIEAGGVAPDELLHLLDELSRA